MTRPESSGSGLFLSSGWQQAACRKCRMLQMRRSRLLAELRIYFESGRGCFAKASIVVIMRACSSTVEQGTHNPLVLGSNPGGPTKTCKANGVTRWPFCIFLVLGSVAVRWRRVMLTPWDSWPCIPHLVAGSSPKSGNTGNHGGYENAAWISGGIFIGSLMRTEFRLTD